MKKYHQLSVFKTDRVKNSFPEYYPAQLVFDLHFIARQSDLKEITIRVYDHNLMLIGSDTRTLVPTNTFSDVNFCIGVEKEAAERPIIVYIYVNDTPRWRAELTVDRRKDVASVTTLTLLEADSDEMYFASKVCNTSWWRNLCAYNFTRNTKTTIMQRIRHYNTMIESKAWSKVPNMCVASNRSVASHLARYVLAEYAGHLEMDLVRNITLEDVARYKDDGFYQFSYTLQSCRIVTIDVERHHRLSYSQCATIDNFLDDVRQGGYPETTFIFYGPKCHVKRFYETCFMTVADFFSDITLYHIGEFDIDMTFMERRMWIEEEERDNKEIEKTEWPDMDSIIDYHYYDGRGKMPELVRERNEAVLTRDSIADSWFKNIYPTPEDVHRFENDYLDESYGNEFSDDFTDRKRRKKDPLHPEEDDEEDYDGEDSYGEEEEEEEEQSVSDDKSNSDGMNDSDVRNDFTDSTEDAASAETSRSPEKASSIPLHLNTGEPPIARSTPHTEPSAPKSDTPPVQPIKNAEQKLQSMIGLERVKREISDARNMALFTQRRNQLHLATPTDNRNHMLFLGNPGTGKTTVAKLIGAMFREMGLLSKGHTVEANRSTLIGEYIGHTEIRTKEAIEKARGGVLFIDEAYSLAIDSKNSGDFGKQALNALLPVLSEPHPDLLVIMAGYEDKIDYMLESNQGLKERFPIRIHFDDFTADELWQIAHLICSQQGFALTPAADEHLRRYIERASTERSESFSNARWVHNLMEHGVMRCMANRVVTTTDATDERLLYTTIEECDIAAAELLQEADTNANSEQKHRIGFI